MAIKERNKGTWPSGLHGLQASNTHVQVAEGLFPKMAPSRWNLASFLSPAGPVLSGACGMRVHACLCVCVLWGEDQFFAIPRKIKIAAKPAFKGGSLQDFFFPIELCHFHF